MANNSLEVICQDWTEHEYESGWGASQRPDGVSLHLNKNNLGKYIDLKWNNRDKSLTPDLYESPSSNYNVLVSQKLFDEISKEEFGLRMYRRSELDLIKSLDIVRLQHE